MKVLVVIGTRPEVIKLAPVIFELKKQRVSTVICATGQHREMVDQSLDAFSIVPDITLDVMLEGQSLNSLGSKLLSRLDDVLVMHNPDWVIVQGDTTSAFFAGLAAFQRNIKVAHVEAGLRTGSLSSPFPEEANRSLLARIATVHFAPTQRSKDALIREGILENSIYVTGNTVVDALEFAMHIDSPAEKEGRIRKLCPESEGKQLVIITCHRRENFGNVIENICMAIKRLSERYSQYHWVFLVHLNPRVQEPVKRILGRLSNISLVNPADYLTTIALLDKAILVVSDSGGIQEEAPSFFTPVVVMRNHTERMEGVDAGFATLAGQDPFNIEEAVKYWLENDSRIEKLKGKCNPYGDGNASMRIVARIQNRSTTEFYG